MGNTRLYVLLFELDDLFKTVLLICNNALINVCKNPTQLNRQNHKCNGNQIILI